MAHDSKKHWAVLLQCAIPAVIIALILFLYSGKKSFFSDEMDQLGILTSVHSLSELLGLYSAVGHEVAPPLFATAAWFWMKIIPFSQRFLQLLPILLTACGVFFLGLAGRSAFSGKSGFSYLLPAVLSLFMPAVSLTAGMQLRQYGLLFFFSSLLVWLFFLRYKISAAGKRFSIPVAILYGIAMAGLPYTHYVSVLLPIGLAAADLVQVLRKKLPFPYLFSYLFGALLFLPWALIIFRSISSRTEFWIDPPRLRDILQTMFFLTDGSDPGLIFSLLVWGLVLIAAQLVTPAKNITQSDRLFPVLYSAVPFFMISAVFLYSKLNPDISLFLDRYFLVLIPLLAVIEARGILDLFRLLDFPTLSGKLSFLLSALTVFLLLMGSVTLWKTVLKDTDTVHEPYLEAADLLGSQSDICSDSTAVFTSNLSQYVTQGWKALYWDSEVSSDVSIYDYSNSSEADSRYSVIYTFVEHASLPSDLSGILAAHYRPDPSFPVSFRVSRYISADQNTTGGNAQ